MFGVSDSEELRMKQRLVMSVLAGVLLVLTGCATLAHEGESGVIALVPFADEQFRVQGVRPVDGWSEQALLIQQSAPVSMEELVAALVADSDLIALPRSTGSYEGRFFTWDLYTFTTRLAEAGPGIYRVDVGLAQGESAVYMVGLVTVPLSYPEHEALYETVLHHAMYALAPL
jgi:hypothetical protein